MRVPSQITAHEEALASETHAGYVNRKPGGVAPFRNRGVFTMKDGIVIVSAARTPVGSFNGAFANLPAHDLGKVAIKAAMERAGVEPARVHEVIMGQILSAGEGQNPARQASIAAGIPVESPAWGINQLCGSGLRAVALGYQQ